MAVFGKAKTDAKVIAVFKALNTAYWSIVYVQVLLLPVRSKRAM